MIRRENNHPLEGRTARGRMSTESTWMDRFRSWSQQEGTDADSIVIIGVYYIHPDSAHPLPTPDPGMQTLIEGDDPRLGVHSTQRLYYYSVEEIELLEES